MVEVLFSANNKTKVANLIFGFTHTHYYNNVDGI